MFFIGIPSIQVVNQLHSTATAPMAERVLWIYIGSVKVNQFRVNILFIVTDKCVLLITFVQGHMLLE